MSKRRRLGIDRSLKIIKTTKRKKKPQDATIRNVKAANKKMDKLSDRISDVLKKSNEPKPSIAKTARTETTSAKTTPATVRGESRGYHERRNVSQKLSQIELVLRMSGADSASQLKALNEIKNILGW